jgi:hypothetical protein
LAPANEIDEFDDCGYNPARTFTARSTGARLTDGMAGSGADRSEFRHEDSTGYCTRYGNCSWHWQRFGGHELRLQIQPSPLVCAVFQLPPPRKG